MSSDFEGASMEIERGTNNVFADLGMSRTAIGKSWQEAASFIAETNLGGISLLAFEAKAV